MRAEQTSGLAGDAEGVVSVLASILKRDRPKPVEPGPRPPIVDARSVWADIERKHRERALAPIMKGQRQ
jgi:hypothetical protein